MTDPLCTVHSLKIGWAPRLRISGGPEFLSFIGALTLGFFVADRLTGSTQVWGGLVASITVVLFWCWSLAVRIAMLVPVVEADDSGIRWRSFFRPAARPWAEVVGVTVGTMFLFPPATPSEWRVPVLVVTCSDGAVHKIRASAWCDRRSLEQWAHEVTTTSIPT